MAGLVHEGTRFPPAALADEDGLVLVGGHLSPDWLIEAYRNGIFPWPILFNHVALLAWFSPDPRAILEWQDFHVPRRLRRRLRNREFEVTADQAFSTVVQRCAMPRMDESETWITPEMRNAYLQLHELGHAHSIEVWSDGRLVGGLYGVACGGVFAGESMFHSQRDASKFALVYLVGHLERMGFQLFDIQQATDHMMRMGASEIDRDAYLQRLSMLRDIDARFGTPKDFALSVRYVNQQICSGEM